VTAGWKVVGDEQSGQLLHVMLEFRAEKPRDDHKCLVFIVTGLVLVKIDLSECQWGENARKAAAQLGKV
jgi:hypothetical protein